MSQRSSLELHLTAVNWLTGLSPTAAGAALLLLFDSKTSPDLRAGIAALVSLLLFGFVFGTLVQLHTIRAIGFQDSSKPSAASASMRLRDTFQYLMLMSLYAAVLILIVGAFYCALRVERREMSSVAGWKLVASSGSAGTETIILSEPKGSQMLLLKRGADDTWITTTLVSQPSENASISSDK